MKQNKFGELIFAEVDVCNLLMKGYTVDALSGMIVDSSVTLDVMSDLLDPVPNFRQQEIHDCSETEWHTKQQSTWHMPEQYQTLDIAAHVLSLCTTEVELQRCGHELLLYQERNLFNLLRYMVYLVDIMTEHNIIWGVGRGSSVASYVLYKLKVHRIDSIYYKLNVEEFLR
jgi:DNA polymerase III alpha subunit|tara:strand:+ start:866 stop:1378 length:513 start_codon:yes stop_codon:yes gene_type:complete